MHNLFLVFLTLKPESHGHIYKVLLLAGVDLRLLIQVHFHQISVFNGLCHSLRVSLIVFFFFTSWELSLVGSFPEATTPFILLSIRLIISLTSLRAAFSFLLVIKDQHKCDH